MEFGGLSWELLDFLWLWRIAAWSVGLAAVAYGALGTTGLWLRRSRLQAGDRPAWLRPVHFATGIALVGLILLLLAIGIGGTLGHYGSLGHSPHLAAGLAVVGVVLASAWSATQIDRRPWARKLHLSLNALLFVGLAFASLSGWVVVQKYL